MTHLEKAVVASALVHSQHPAAPGSAYDANMRPQKVPALVNGVPNHRLLDLATYRAGYRYAWRQIAEALSCMVLDPRTTSTERRAYAKKNAVALLAALLAEQPQPEGERIEE